MEKDKEKQNERPKRNETVVIIDKEMIRKLPNPPEHVIDNIVAALKKYFS